MDTRSSPPPRFATARNLDRATFGPQVATVSRHMGADLMPWQKIVADVSGEVDDHGRYVYPLVVISVPRQSGKTTLVMANGVHRCLSAPRRKVWHTAQTGQDARKKWLEMTEAFAASPLGSMGKVLRTNGSEGLILSNGSTFRPHPPTQDSIHGDQSDLNNIDEGWAFTEAEGDALMQAIVPSQSTRPGAQTVILSTMGSAASTWFHNLSDLGREGDPGIAYFEWSIPDNVAEDDLDAVCAAHPAFGYTIDRTAIERAYNQMKSSPGAFARAYGNRRTGAAIRIIPLERWAEAQTTDTIPAGARPAFGAAVSIDRSETAICAAAMGPDGVPIVELIEHRPGTTWAPARLAELDTRHRSAGICVDTAGPSATVADALTIGGVSLVPFTARDAGVAAANMLDRLDPPDASGLRLPVAVRIRTDPALSAAADIAAKRAIGDGWGWSRKSSAGSIAPLEAATLALYALLHQPVAPPAPRVWVPA